jgi:hypothetical protein
MSVTDKDRGRTREHVHSHNGVTSCDFEHSHMHPGVTGPPIYADLYGKDHHYKDQHYHEITGLTTYDRGHFHYYRANNGPAIPVERGNHTHYVNFRTSFNDGHDHRIEGFIEVTPSG